MLEMLRHLKPEVYHQHRGFILIVKLVVDIVISFPGKEAESRLLFNRNVGSTIVVMVALLLKIFNRD